MGGAWLVRDILQPWAEVGWARSAADDLSVNAVRFGGGLAVGHPLARGRLWLGAAAIARAMWATARDVRRGSAWASTTFVGEVLQLRLQRVPLLFVFRAGADLTGPPLRFVGRDAEIRWRPARFSASLGVGVSLGRRQAHR